MSNEPNVPKYFRVDAVSIACYVLNRMHIRPILRITLMKLLNEKSRRFLI